MKKKMRKNFLDHNKNNFHGRTYSLKIIYRGKNGNIFLKIGTYLL